MSKSLDDNVWTTTDQSITGSNLKFCAQIHEIKARSRLSQKPVFILKRVSSDYWVCVQYRTIQSVVMCVPEVHPRRSHAADIQHSSCTHLTQQPLKNASFKINQLNIFPPLSSLFSCNSLQPEMNIRNQYYNKNSKICLFIIFAIL